MESRAFPYAENRLSSRDGIRWAVGSQDDRRSSTWRLWGDKKGDIYISVRGMGGILKASFHKDRRCNMGFTQEFKEEAKQRFGAETRHWQRWTLPESPVAKALQILIPDSELNPFSCEEKVPMAWIPAPGKGKAVVFTLFIAEPPEFVSWESPEKSGNLLGIILCKTRGTWLVHKSQDLDQTTINFLEENRAKALQEVKSKVHFPDSESLRMTLWGHGETEKDVFFIELAVPPIHLSACLPAMKANPIP